MLFDDEPQPLRVCVTGGAEGLGLAIAKRFHDAEARVHICHRSAQTLVETLAEHPGMHGTVADVGSASDVNLFVAEAHEWMGGIDVLVNAADEPGPRQRIEDLSVEDWQRTLDVNLSGMFYCIREVAPLMREQRGGSIVNIASTSARTGLPKRVGYVVSKAGVLGLTHNVARELGPDNVRCNAILPGMIDNDSSRSLIESRARRGLNEDVAEAELLSRVSMRSWITPDEVAELAVYLASDAARHISGQQIGVCGNVEWE